MGYPLGDSVEWLTGFSDSKEFSKEHIKKEFLVENYLMVYPSYFSYESHLKAEGLFYMVQDSPLLSVSLSIIERDFFTKKILKTIKERSLDWFEVWVIFNVQENMQVEKPYRSSSLEEEEGGEVTVYGISLRLDCKERKIYAGYLSSEHLFLEFKNQKNKRFLFIGD